MPTELFLHDETWPETRAALTEAYNAAVRRGSREPIDVIHGWGSSGEGGVKRRALRTFLTRHGIEFTPGEQFNGNPGQTRVFPGKLLPTAENALQAAVLGYCSAPKTKAQIDGKFRKHGVPAVNGALKALQGAGLIRTINGAGKEYTATGDDG